ncbi:MAG: DUF5519 family protein [Halalkalicoccus sp.]
MATKNSSAAAGDRVIETVSSWPGVEIGPHRFGATEFTVDGREIGHVHGGRTLDINFPKRIRDRLVADGETGEHRFAGGGWTTYRVDSPKDIDRALWLLRLSYLYSLLTMRRKPAGRSILAGFDLDAELDRLDPDPEVRAAFDRMR